MILQLILTIFIFFTIKYLIFKITEKGLPAFINYQPYSCYKCCSFWVLLFIYINSIITLQLWYMGIIGIIITILDAVALHIDEMNTVSVNEIDI